MHPPQAASEYLQKLKHFDLYWGFKNVISMVVEKGHPVDKVPFFTKLFF